MEVGMKWSWKIGSFKGIGVFMHATFLLIIAWVGFTNWQQTRSLAGMLEGILFTLVLFGTVVLHEFGHALTARRYGIKTRDITLYPIGGVARLERMPDKPVQEFWVAVAGPAVNIVIAALLFIWQTFAEAVVPLSGINLSGGQFVERLIMVNLFLVVFNLIPAFPMDGGRILRSLLAMRMEYPRATQIAATIGQGIAVLFAIVGLFSNPFLVFIAFFVWVGASQEASMERTKSALDGIQVSRLMLTDFKVLSPQDSLGCAVDLTLQSSQTDFPVVENGAVIGLLRRADIMTGLSRQGQFGLVSDVMQRDLQWADADEMVELALLRMQNPGSSTIPVTMRGKLVGLLTSENIREFLLIQSAINKAPRRDGLVRNSA
jgi:Zn-dependent protease/predicted transcriptional regulator